MTQLRKAWLMLLLLVFSWHGLVLQSHVHAPTRAGLSGRLVFGDAHSGQALAVSGARGTPTPETCPIEREGALSGAFLAPDLPTYLVHVQSADRLDAICAQHSDHRAVAHNWRSRAPPISLNA